MHVFLLILSITGQPERIAAVCETYQRCSDEGAQYQAQYAAVKHLELRDVSYRIEPGLVLKLPAHGGTA